MAHFAKIDSNNIVETIISINNNDAPDEQTGIEFISSLGLEGVWKQTSYNTLAGEHLLDGTPFRKNYAGIGMIYDEQRDAFITPSPYPSWVLDEETCTWKPPLDKPKPAGTDLIGWRWNEEIVGWEQFDKPVVA